jgi:diguanylate cyclase (GGDEF)-like protein
MHWIRRSPLGRWLAFRVAGQPRVPLLFVGGAALLVGAGLLVAVLVWQLRADALEESQRDIANLGVVLAEQTARSVQAVDVVLRGLQDDIGKYDLPTPEEFRRVLGTQKINDDLKTRALRLSQTDAMTIVDADGYLINTSRRWPVPNFDLTDRDFYRHFRKGSDSQTFISEPIRNYTTGSWAIYLVRRIDAADGTFLGMVLGAIDLRYFEGIYGSINLSRQEIFLLARRDGTVLLRHPDKTSRTGDKIASDSPWYERVAQGGGVFTSTGHFDGMSRMMHAQVLNGYPLVVNVGVTEDAALAEWRRQAAIILGGSLVVFIYTVFLMRTARRQLRDLRSSEASLTRHNEDLCRLSQQLQSSQTSLADRTRELEMTLETMDQGLILVDAAGIVVICNRRAVEMLDLPAEMMNSKPRFIDQLDYQWRINHSSRQEGTFEEFVRARTVVDRPSSMELRRPDGRILEVRSMPIGDGGVVRTYTDITQRKTAEERTHYLAHHDDLTRLANRVGFRNRLQEAIEIARISRRGLAVLYLDLDQFKQINDRRGHAVGDRVLAEAAQRMRAAVRSVDTVGRLGGDEFAIILPFVDKPPAIAVMGERLVDVLSVPFIIDGEAAACGASVGIALYPEDGQTADKLIAHADQALYAAKSAGRNTFRFYRPPELQVVSG